MPVDTYLKRKNVTSGYQVVNEGDVQLLVAFGLTKWAGAIHIDVSKFLFWKRFTIDAEPKHPHVHGST